MSDAADNINAGAGVVRELYGTIGEEDKQQISENIGAALVTLSSAVKNVLLPIAAVNCALDKARNYFAKDFEQELGEQVADIPPEALIEPKASIAAPIVQGLVFAVDEPDLKAMYLKLLASAMDGRSADSAHPAFVEVLKQCSAQDLKLIDYFAHLRTSNVKTIDIYSSYNNKHAKKFGNIGPYIIEAGLDFKSYMVTVDNLMRLGMIKVGPKLASSYSEIIETFTSALTAPSDIYVRETFETTSQSLMLTAFGKSFVISCIRPELKGYPLNYYS